MRWLLILIDAVFPRPDQEQTEKQDRHLQWRDTDVKSCDAPNADQVNQSDGKREQNTNPKK